MTKFDQITHLSRGTKSKALRPSLPRYSLANGKHSFHLRDRKTQLVCSSAKPSQPLLLVQTNELLKGRVSLQPSFRPQHFISRQYKLIKRPTIARIRQVKQRLHIRKHFQPSQDLLVCLLMKWPSIYIKCDILTSLKLSHELQPCNLVILSTLRCPQVLDGCKQSKNRSKDHRRTSHLSLRSHIRILQPSSPTPNTAS